MTPQEVLKKHWGYDSFRPLQLDIIESVLQGRDTLGLMPTGGGKSITFQVPGLMLGGMTLVITPLISLMKDQVDNLRRHGIRAAMLHATMTSYENRTTWERINAGKASFLYISPERLGGEVFINDIRSLPVKLIVVDEAHCISQWGYDFRPAYLSISKIRRIFPDVPVLALTATATPRVAQDIGVQLNFHNAALFTKSFARDNLSYIVRRPKSLKLDELVHILEHTYGSAIVYVRSRKRTREISDLLNLRQISSTFYHAGLNFEVKEERHNLWSRGEKRVMVATNAFGMGIDKPDVRLVVHYDMPPSLEEYYQEAGRAGRDGLKSYAVLLVTDEDRSLMRRRLSLAYPKREDIVKIYERICNYLNISVGEGSDSLREFDLSDFCKTFRLNEAQVAGALKILGWSGWLEHLSEMGARSRLILTVSREELYERHGLSANAERVLQCVLRLYGGIFVEFQYIDENRIGSATGLDIQQVYDALIDLGRAKIISYIPRSKLPFIHLLTAREETRYITIPKSAYEERRARDKERMDAMLDYACSSRKCRVARMLAYFGEKSGEDCGRCDVCRQKR